jgi:hypothetical protein
LIRSEKVGLELRDEFPDDEKDRGGSSRELPGSRFLDSAEQATSYIKEHANQIKRAVLIPHAFLFFPDNGEPHQEREAGMVLHLADGRLRFLGRETAETILNGGLLNRLKIRMELPR